MENNRFCEVPSVVGDMPRLRELRVTSNRIMEMPTFLSTLNSLTHLDVDHNRLSGATPSCLTGLHSLRILNLSHNGLNELASELTKLRFPFDEMRPATLFARTMSQKQLRRLQIHLLLNGGEKTSYRIRERLPLADTTGGSRPPGAGDRHGWALVRFVVFGEQGHDVDRDVPASLVSSSSSSSDAEKDDEDEPGVGASMLNEFNERGKELDRARRGLVKKIRHKIFAARLPGSKRTVASFLGLDNEMDFADQHAPLAQGAAPVVVDAAGAATGSGPYKLDTVRAQEQEDREFQDLVARYTF